jgi:hypothetical protein
MHPIMLYARALVQKETPARDKPTRSKVRADGTTGGASPALPAAWFRYLVLYAAWFGLVSR